MIKRLDHGGGVLELCLNRPPANAIDPELAVALTDAVRAAPTQGYRAVVLSGSPGRYSGGLDVPVLLALDREGLTRFWARFNEMLAALAECPVPLAAAMTGHAPAGGTVLAAFCDYRVMAMGDYRMGFTETQVGLPLPHGIYAAFERICGPRIASRYAMEGRVMTGPEALAIGLVDELVPLGEVVERAAAWCHALLQLPSYDAVAQTRRYARAGLIAALERGAVDPEAMSGIWFREDTQRVMRALAEKLRGKR